MGCCGEREKFGDSTNEQRWDYINLSDFRCTSCWTAFSYGIVWYFLLLSIGVYAVDLFLVTNLLFFNRWSSQVKPAIPFEISRWVFAGCIILSYLLLAYRWWRALRAMRAGVITASYLDPLAVRIESVRVTKTGQGWRRFLVFAALTKGRKGSEYVALYTYFAFEAWLRLIFAEGPRQVINGLTLYSVMRADLLPTGSHAATRGHTPIVQFFVNIQILANHNKEQAAILLGMLYTLIVWVFSALGLAFAFLMYITFLWHHIPSQDGSLSRFCRRKIESRLQKIVRKRVDKALAKDIRAKARLDAKIPTVAVDDLNYKRQPTLPILDDNSDASSIISRQPTRPDLNPFGSRPSTPDVFGRPGAPQRGPTLPDLDPFRSRPSTPDVFGRPGAPQRGPTLPDLDPFRSRPSTPDAFGRPGTPQRAPNLPDVYGNIGRPGAPSRNATQSSLHSDTSYSSDAPLMTSAADMGYDKSRSQFRNGPSRMDSETTLDSARPPYRAYTSTSQSTQHSFSAGPSRMGPPSRQNTDQSSRTNNPAPYPSRMAPPSRQNTDQSSRTTTPAPYPSQPPGRKPTPLQSDPSFSSTSSPRRTPVPGHPPQFRPPPQEYEMHPPGPPAVIRTLPPRSASATNTNVPYTAFNPQTQTPSPNHERPPPSRNFTQPYRPPLDQFGASRPLPPRAGTAPLPPAQGFGGYSPSIVDEYRGFEFDAPSTRSGSVPLRPGTAALRPGPGGEGERAAYRPPRF